MYRQDFVKDGGAAFLKTPYHTFVHRLSDRFIAEMHPASREYYSRVVVNDMSPDMVKMYYTTCPRGEIR